jgi:hypothetical protein
MFSRGRHKRAAEENLCEQRRQSNEAADKRMVKAESETRKQRRWWSRTCLCRNTAR